MISTDDSHVIRSHSLIHMQAPVPSQFVALRIQMVALNSYNVMSHIGILEIRSRQQGNRTFRAFDELLHQ